MAGAIAALPSGRSIVDEGGAGRKRAGRSFAGQRPRADTWRGAIRPKAASPGRLIWRRSDADVDRSVPRGWNRGPLREGRRGRVGVRKSVVEANTVATGRAPATAHLDSGGERDGDFTSAPTRIAIGVIETTARPWRPHSTQDHVRDTDSNGARAPDLFYEPPDHGGRRPPGGWANARSSCCSTAIGMNLDPCRSWWNTCRWNWSERASRSRPVRRSTEEPG